MSSAKQMHTCMSVWHIATCSSTPRGYFWKGFLMCNPSLCKGYVSRLPISSWRSNVMDNSPDASHLHRLLWQTQPIRWRLNYYFWSVIGKWLHLDPKKHTVWTGDGERRLKRCTHVQASRDWLAALNTDREESWEPLTPWSHSGTWLRPLWVEPEVVGLESPIQ